METLKFIYVLQIEKKWVLEYMNRPPYSLWQSGEACSDIRISKKKEIIQSIWMLLCYNNFTVDGISGVFLKLQYKTAHDII